MSGSSGGSGEEELRKLQRDRMKRMETLNTFDAKEWAAQQEKQMESALTTMQDGSVMIDDEFAHLLDAPAQQGAWAGDYGAGGYGYQDDYNNVNYGYDNNNNYAGDYADYSMDYSQPMNAGAGMGVSGGEEAHMYEGVTTSPEAQQQMDAERERLRLEQQANEELRQQLLRQQQELEALKEKMSAPPTATPANTSDPANTTEVGEKSGANTTAVKTGQTQQEGGPPGEDNNRLCTVDQHGNRQCNLSYCTIQ